MGNTVSLQETPTPSMAEINVMLVPTSASSHLHICISSYLSVGCVRFIIFLNQT